MNHFVNSKRKAWIETGERIQTGLGLGEVGLEARKEHENSTKTVRKQIEDITFLHTHPHFQADRGVPLTRNDIFRQKSDMKRTFFEQSSPFFAHKSPFFDGKRRFLRAPGISPEG
jgi:hypothetical protein